MTNGGNMGTYRIYPDKSNTLMENRNTNTGENEVMELWYGEEGITRHLIKFDIDGYKALYQQGFVPHVTATTVTFNMKNCYPIFERGNYADAVPATSTDIEVRAMTTDWDSGIGYDFRAPGRVDGYSNWYSSTTLVAWSAHGGDYSGVMCTQTFDKGNEDISCTVSDTSILEEAFTGENNGMIIKFTDAVEALTGETQSILKFFTENAPTTYYSPYIELTWDTDQIQDQRDELSYNLTRRLYLYTRYYDQFAAPADISGVTIEYVHPSYTDEFYPASSIITQYPGVYYIEYTGPAAEAGDSTFTDTWHVQFEVGNGWTDVIQDGDLEAGAAQWNTGQTDVLQSVEYNIHMPNLADHYHIGDIIYLDVQVYEPYITSTDSRVVLKNMEYKIRLLDGMSSQIVVDWSNVSYTQDINGFSLSTSWMQAGYDYDIEFRYSVNGAVSKTAEDTFKFRIIEGH